MQAKPISCRGRDLEDTPVTQCLQCVEPQFDAYVPAGHGAQTGLKAAGE